MPEQPTFQTTEEGDLIGKPDSVEEVRKALWEKYDKASSKRKERAAKDEQLAREVYGLHESGLSWKKSRDIVAKRAGIHPDTIKDWFRELRKHHPCDWRAALLDKRDGRQATKYIDPQKMARIKSLYYQQSGRPAKQVYREVARMMGSDDLLSYDAVLYRLKKDPRWLDVIRRKGPKAAEFLYPCQERDYTTLRNNSAWIGDGTVGDTHITFQDGSIGRLVIYFLMDAHSRMIVSYGTDRVESARLVKRTLLKSLRVHGIPDEFIVDNGRGGAAKSVSGGVRHRNRFQAKPDEIIGLAPMVGTNVVFTNPYSGKSKGALERFNRTFHENVDRCFDGAWGGSSVVTRPANFEPKNANVSPEQYEAAIANFVVVYNDTPHRSLGNKTPRQVREEGLRLDPITRLTEEQLRYLSHDRVKVRLNPRDGCVRILGNRYWNPKCAELRDDGKYEASYNPDDATEDIALYRDGRFLCKAQLQHPAGFRDTESARKHNRDRRKYLKSLNMQAEAIVGMRDAESWAIPSEPAPHAPENVVQFPREKVTNMPPRLPIELPPAESRTTHDDGPTGAELSIKLAELARKKTDEELSQDESLEVVLGLKNTGAAK